MKTIPSPPHSIKAFSLVELLVVIAVIAIVAAIALPNLINISHKSTFAKNRRNAQTVASIASAAKGAGVTSDLSGTNAISILQPPGVAVISGNQELSFSVSPMSQEDQEGAALHLESSGDINMAVRLKEEQTPGVRFRSEEKRAFQGFYAMLHQLPTVFSHAEMREL